jgi:hypothetical protein
LKAAKARAKAAKQASRAEKLKLKAAKKAARQAKKKVRKAKEALIVARKAAGKSQAKAKNPPSRAGKKMPASQKTKGSSGLQGRGKQIARSRTAASSPVVPRPQPARNQVRAQGSVEPVTPVGGGVKISEPGSDSSIHP